MKSKNSLIPMLMVILLFLIMIILSIGARFLTNEKQIQDRQDSLGSINNFIDLSESKNHQIELIGKDGDKIENIEIKHQFVNFNKTEGELLQHYKPVLVKRQEKETVRNGELVSVRFVPRNETKLKEDPVSKEYQVGRDVYSFVVKSLELNDKSKDLLQKPQDLSNPFAFVLHSDFIFADYGAEFEKQFKDIRSQVDGNYNLLNKEENVSFNDYVIADVDDLYYPEAKSIKGFGRMYELMVRDDNEKVVPLIIDFRVEKMNNKISNQRAESGRIVYEIDSDIKVLVKSNVEIKNIGTYEKIDLDDDISDLIDAVLKDNGDKGGIVLMPLPSVKRELLNDLLDG